jgi:hypothetical protein
MLSYQTTLIDPTYQLYPQQAVLPQERDELPEGPEQQEPDGLGQQQEQDGSGQQQGQGGLRPGLEVLVPLQGDPSVEEERHYGWVLARLQRAKQRAALGGSMWPSLCLGSLRNCKVDESSKVNIIIEFSKGNVGKRT